MVNYEFLNPNDDPQIEQQAMQSGIQPLILNVREKDQVKQQKVFLGAKIIMENKLILSRYYNPVQPWNMHFHRLLRKSR